MLLEKGDRPCRVALYGGVLDPTKGDTGRLLAKGSLGPCGELTIEELVDPLVLHKGTWTDSIVASIDGYQDHFVNGIQVCDSKNKNNHRIKGLGLHPAKVEKYGQVTPWKWPQLRIPSDAKARQTNCGAFGTTPRTEAKFCPDTNDMVAVGVVMHHDGSSFTGIQLVCRRITAGFIEPLKKDATGY